MFSQIDINFMQMAMNEARNCYSRGDLPVGAVLTLDNNLEGIAGNSARTNGDWTSHAENSLLHMVSWKIKQNPHKKAILYTTWEPCMMCTGATIVSRINEIIYACQDSIGGMSKIDSSKMGYWNERHWPVFRQGPFAKESYALLLKYMKENQNIWKTFLEKFEKIAL